MPRNRLWRPAIEFNLTEHCNLSCTHCDHASSVMPSKFADLKSFTRDIETLSTVLQARELKFVGGEPLLHPQLLDFLRVAKDVQIANRLLLVTNGVLLHKVPDELWELIDGMWISIYPGIKYRFDWDWIQQKANEYQIFVWRKETPEFAQRSLIEEMKNEEFVRMVFENCDLAHLESCHTIYEGRYYICAPSVWTEQRLALHGVTFTNRESDSVAIHDNPNLYDDLDNLIRTPEPLDACRYCLGSWARYTPNKQLTRKGTEEFLTRGPEDLAELVDPELMVPQSYTDQNRPR
jgi:organic radical activating enzyme